MTAQAEIGSSSWAGSFPRIATWLVLLILSGVSLIFWDTLGSLIARWQKMDESYSHGWLVCGISVFLMLKHSWSYSGPLRHYSWAALYLLLPASLLWVLGNLIDIIVIQQLMLPVFVFSLIAFIAGFSLAKQLAVAIGFLYFAIPIWDHLLHHLVDITVIVVSQVLPLTDIPALIEGNRITIPAGQIIVADGCSGIRYFIVSLAFSALYGHLYLGRFRHKLGVLIAGGLLGLFANWLRVASLIVIGHVTDMESSLMSDHELYGFALFGALLFSYSWLLGSIFQQEPLSGAASHESQSDVCAKLPDDNDGPAIKAEEPSAALAVTSSQAVKLPSSGGMRRWELLSNAVIGMLMLFFFASLPKLVTEPGKPQLFARNLTYVPTPSLSVADMPASPFSHPHLANAEQNLTLLMPQSDKPYIYQLFHFSQKQRYADYLPYRDWLNREDYVVLKRTRMPVAHRNTDQVGALQLLNKQDGTTWNLLYWFEVGEWVAVNPYLAKTAELLALIQGRRDARLALLYAPCQHQCEQEMRLLAQRLNQYPELLPE